MTSVSGTQRTNTLAIVAFIAAFVVPVAGLVLGVMSRRQLSVPANTEAGVGLARWAIVLGIAFTTFQLIFFAVWLALLVSVFPTHSIVS